MSEVRWNLKRAPDRVNSRLRARRPGLGNAAKGRSLLLRATIGHTAKQSFPGTLLMLGTAALLATPVSFLVAIFLTGLDIIGVCATVILATLAAPWHDTAGRPSSTDLIRFCCNDRLFDPKLKNKNPI